MQDGVILPNLKMQGERECCAYLDGNGRCSIHPFLSLIHIFLVENRGTAVSRERLMDRIWTDGAAYVEENALSVTVKRLRDKLGAAGYIRTVYGIGYMWKKEG